MGISRKASQAFVRTLVFMANKDGKLLVGGGLRHRSNINCLIA